MVKDQANIYEWHTLMEKAYTFSDWYHTTPRSDRAYLCPIKLEKNIPIPKATPVLDTLQKSCISGFFDIEQQNESKKIRKYVMEFVLDITRKVGRSHKKFAATPILSGSVAEGTKVGFPDEYDFILHLHRLQHKFDLTKKTAMIPNTQHFNAEMAMPQLYKQYFHAFSKQVEKYDNTKNFFLHHITPQDIGVRPFTITLLYTGIFFKDLKVNIDLAPAFKISGEAVEAEELQFIQEGTNPQILAVFKEAQSEDESLRLSFSLHERDLLKYLPMYAKNGYCLAKAVRHIEVCPMVKVSGTFASVDEYVTTYMIKTSLLHTMKELEANQNEDNDWLSPLSIKWAIKIYEQMKFFLEIFEGKIPNYFQPNADLCSRYGIFMCGETDYRQEKLKITLIFINYILQLLNKLLQQCLQL